MVNPPTERQPAFRFAHSFNVPLGFIGALGDRQGGCNGNDFFY